MKNRRNKWLIVAGCLAVCAVLVGLIGNGFTREVVLDAPLSVADDETGVEVNPSAKLGGAEGGDDGEESGDAPVVVVRPETQTSPGNADGGAVYRGTEQTIQSDAAKPEYSEETLTDPAQTPDGRPVSDPPRNEDHGSVQTPPPQERPITGGTPGGLPGFDDVPDLGPNQSASIDSDGDINKQVGIMG